ncbi:histidine phosphatase family protein [Natronosporangium hydrolyticum]|uniref:Histidine phosphatase family protein n=1 Tax=Natronosporangium hydrolyticum TaxID=2811111 RepID=A0A895YAD1_9ACTN|nr:histidine phosphatase family protein [Natronosporangium hydrolyticum]QSB14734.1 histidine phosphatase family protein [Natronosporangium hydrolyticum]
MTARRLVLLRHAKAENPVGTSDEDRPLSARGRADAHAAGGWLAANQPPELVLCSPAKRTRQTWHAVATGLGQVSPHVSYERRLYAGGLADALTLLQEVDDAVGSVLLIGHNPTLSQLAFDLAPEGPLDSDGLRTAGLALLEIPGGWGECAPGNARLTATHTARG